MSWDTWNRRAASYPLSYPSAQPGLHNFPASALASTEEMTSPKLKVNMTMAKHSVNRATARWSNRFSEDLLEIILKTWESLHHSRVEINAKFDEPEFCKCPRGCSNNASYGILLLRTIDNRKSVENNPSRSRHTLEKISRNTTSKETINLRYVAVEYEERKTSAVML